MEPRPRPSPPGTVWTPTAALPAEPGKRLQATRGRPVNDLTWPPRSFQSPWTSGAQFRSLESSKHLKPWIALIKSFSEERTRGKRHLVHHVSQGAKRARTRWGLWPGPSRGGASFLPQDLRTNTVWSQGERNLPRSTLASSSPRGASLPGSRGTPGPCWQRRGCYIRKRRRDSGNADRRARPRP